MALTKTLMPVMFKGGLAQKTSDKLVAPGDFLALENCVRRKTATVEKRFGFRSLGQSIIGDGAVSAGTFVGTFKDDLIMIGNDTLYAYSAGNDAWLDKGGCPITSLTTSSIVRNQAVQAAPDTAYSNGLMCTIYTDSRGGVRYSIVDDETGAIIVYDRLIDAIGKRPRIVATQYGFLLCYLKSNGTNYDMLAQPISYVTPTTLDMSLLKMPISPGVLDYPWDLIQFNNAAAFAFNNSGNTISIGYLDMNGNVGTGLSLPGTIVTSGTGDAQFSLSIIGDPANSRLWILYSSFSPGNITAIAYSSDLLVFSSVTIESSASSRNMTGVPRAADSQLVLYYEMNTPSRDSFIKTARVSWAGSGSATVTASATVHMRSVGLWSKAYQIGAHQYITATHDNTLQPVYFTVRNDARVVGKMLQEKGGGATRDPSRAAFTSLCSVVTDFSGGSATVLQERIQLQITDDGTVLAPNIGLTKASLIFSAPVSAAELGDNCHFAGGLIQAYDGVSVTELGFSLWPEGKNTANGVLDIVSAAGSTAFVTTDLFFIQAIYEWTDGKGQIHRSAPSILKTISPAANTNKITVKIPTVRTSSKPGTSINLVVYAAVVDSSVLTRYMSVANDPTVDEVTIDITTYPSLAAEILYTTGGVVENIAPPAGKAILNHKQRLFLCGTEDHQIWYTKFSRDGQGLAFQDINLLPIESDGGDPTAMATMDEKLIIFKKSHIYFESGDGPLDTGQQNDYFIPIRLAKDVGTTNPQSVTVITQGTLFKSDKGIYLLNRQLRTSYIGAGVDNFNDLTVTSAALLPDVDEVRFTTATGPTLVYNYFFSQWSTFNNYAATSATVWQDSYIHLKSAGLVNREQAVYDDNGVRIQMAIETSWFAMAGIQGFQRIYKALLLGDFINHHYCRVRVAYDYEDAYNETIIFNTQIGLDATSVFGEGVTYGSVTPYGGSGSTVFQCRILPAKQQCESFKMRIEDVDSVTAVGGGCFKLLSVGLEVGRKYGAFKLSARKTVG